MNNHSFTKKSNMEKSSASGSSNFRTSRMDLVCYHQYKKKSPEISFLRIDNKSAVTSINPELGFSSKDHIQIISSCNGLLLLTSKNKSQLMYHVFNPFTNQTFSLPQPSFTQRIVRCGLAVSDKHNHFQVVLVHISTGLELEIFCSETGKWKKHKPTNLFLPVPVKKLFPEHTVPPLYSNGAIHWEVLGNLLVYDVQTFHCNLFKLPNVSDDNRHRQSTETFQRCMWESEGRVHYCYTDVEGIHTWYLLNEQDLEFYSKYNIDGKKFKWKLADSVPYQTLMKNYPNIFQGLSRTWKPRYLSPFAYNEASKTMYIQLPGTVICYNTKTGVLKEVFTFKVPGKDYNCSFFPFVYGGQISLECVGNSKPSEAKIEFESNFAHKKIRKFLVRLNDIFLGNFSSN